MAKVQGSTEATQPEQAWETLRTGLGTEWDFSTGPIEGIFVEMVTMPVRDWNSDDPTATRDANAFLFAIDGDEPTHFVWGSAEIDKAMEQANPGDRIRISFLGVERFTGENGPQQIKRYRVQRAMSY